MLQKPEEPKLAPDKPTDNELAIERFNFGRAYRELECKFDGLVAYVLQKPAPDCQVGPKEPPT
jgi:hypothetical protein